MVAQERLITVEYSDTHRSNLEKFCLHCEQLGYHNNSSLSAMKLDWCLNKGGQFFLTYLDDKLIGLSGCHPLTQLGQGIFRVLFRGIELPEYRNILGIPSKTHMSSVQFYYHMPLEIEWAKKQGANTFVVTTNWNNPDGIESMNKSHRVFQLLAKQGIVSCLEEKIVLYETEQSVWSINTDNYFSARIGFKERNGLHQ